jgi:drug/metabolite transporter (DMT)-like permease
MKSQRSVGGVLLVAMAATLWSTSGFFAKAPVFDGWEPMARVIQMGFWRAAFASLVIIFLVRSPRWSWRMVPMMACFVAMCWAFLQALVTIESSTAIWLQYTAPVFVLLGNICFFHETIRKQDIWFMSAAFAGLAIILYGQVGQASSAGLMYGVLAGVFYAGVILSLRGLRQYDSAWLVFLNQAATAAVLLPFALRSGVWPTGIQWGYLAGFGIVQLCLPYLIFTRGLRSITSHEASLIVLLEPLLVPVWVFLVWRNAADYEPPKVLTLVGGAIILFSLVARYMPELLQARRGRSSQQR